MITEHVAVVPLNDSFGAAAGACIGPVACAAMPINMTRIKDNANICFLIIITSLHVVSTTVTNEGGDL